MTVSLFGNLDLIEASFHICLQCIRSTLCLTKNPGLLEPLLTGDLVEDLVEDLWAFVKLRLN